MKVYKEDYDDWRYKLLPIHIGESNSDSATGLMVFKNFYILIKNNKCFHLTMIVIKYVDGVWAHIEVVMF